MTLVHGSTRDLWLLRSLEGMSAKRAGFRSQAAQIDPAFSPRGNTSDRWRFRIDSYSWALRGACRTAMASGTNAVHGAMYARTSSASTTLSGFENLEEGRASQRKLASLSFDAAGFRPWPAYRSRCVRAIAQ